MNRAALVVLVVGAACRSSVKMPTEQDARDMLRNREKPLLELTDFIQKQLEKSHVPGAPCGDTPACKSSIGSFESAVNAELPRFADAAGAFGIEGRLVRQDKNVAVIALPPCQRLSSVTQFYTDAGEYLIAWGDGFRDKSDGQHPGVIIQWRFPYQDAEFRMTACFLLDGTARQP